MQSTLRPRTYPLIPRAASLTEPVTPARGLMQRLTYPTGSQPPSLIATPLDVLLQRLMYTPTHRRGSLALSPIAIPADDLLRRYHYRPAHL
jgi:hypothetical protein